MTRTFNILLLIFLVLPAHAATLHVSISGDERGPGTAAQPYRTIGRAVEAARDGDSIVVRSGTYHETILLHGVRNVRLSAGPGETVAIDGAGVRLGEGRNALVSIRVSRNVSITGFEIRNSPAAGVFIVDSQDVTVRGNRIINTQTFGIHATATEQGGTRRVTIEKNDVERTVRSNERPERGQGWNQALSVLYVAGASIRNNRVRYNYGEGIDVIASRKVAVAGNHVHDNFSVNIYVDASEETTIDANLVTTSPGRREFFRNGRPASGIVLARERYRGGFRLSEIEVTNNIVLGCRSALTYGAWEEGGGLHRSRIVHNVFSGSTGALLTLERERRGRHSNTVVANNIFLQQGGGAFSDGSSTGLTFRNNLWWGGGTASTIVSGTGDLRRDPLFASGSGPLPARFRLRSGSPAVNAGWSGASASRDFFGASRGGKRGAPDLGIHER